MKKNRVGAVLVSLLMLLSGLVVATATPAAAATKCHTFNRHWSLREGSVSTKIGWVELHVEVCTNGKSITSMSSTTESDETGPGTFAGFDVSVSKPRRSKFSSGSLKKDGIAQVVADGRTKACGALTFGTVCSYSGTWRIWMNLRLIHGKVLPAPYRLPKGTDTVFGGRGWAHQWKHACTNKVCGTRFS